MTIRFSAFPKRAVFLLALLFLSAGALRAQTSLKDRTEIFEQVWATINEKYYDASFNGVDWNAVKAKYAARLKNAASDKDFYVLLDRMAGELRDSHTRVYSPAQREERKNQRHAGVGIIIKNVENVPVVFSVAPDSEAARAGVKPGMIVRLVNEQPIEKAISEARLAVGVSSSERATEMRVFSKIFSGEPGTVLNLELTGSDGQTRSFSLTRRLVSVAPQIESRVLSSGIAYLKFGKFDEALEEQIGQALESLKDARGLILDLRGNGGGDGETGLRFAGRFLSDKVTIARLVTRTGKPPVPDMPMTLEAGETGAQMFSRPLVILVNEGTASTAELIANALQEQKRAVVFGTNSCGCVLAFLDFKSLKGGGEMSFSEFGFVTARGKRLEGSGVVPDRLVPLKLIDVRAERDAALDEAERYLKSLF